MKCFKCAHSGLLLPPDYKENWGIYYGHGLGPVPVSECLNSDMRANVGKSRAQTSVPPADHMFPFHHTRADIVLVDVPEEEYNNPDRRMILHIDDRDYKKRSNILREKQKLKPAWKQLDFIQRPGAASVEREVWR